MGTAEEDYKALLMAILTQAMNDYVKLQHPKYRKKKYLQEAFESSVKMLFDDSFEFLYLRNENGDNMSFKEMLSYFISEKNMDLQKLRVHLIKEAKTFWENKLLNVLEVPQSFIYDGHVYDTVHSPDDSSVDYVEKIIYINKENDNSDTQQAFIKCAVEIMLYHEEIPISGKNIEKLAKAFFRMLRVNSCFLES